VPLLGVSDPGADLVHRVPCVCKPQASARSRSGAFIDFILEWGWRKIADTEGDRCSLTLYPWVYAAGVG